MIYQQHNAAADAPAEKTTDVVPLFLFCLFFAAAAMAMDFWVTADAADAVPAADAVLLSGYCSSFAAAAEEMVSAASKVSSQQ